MTILTPTFIQQQPAKQNGDGTHETWPQTVPIPVGQVSPDWKALTREEATKRNAGFLAPSIPAPSQEQTPNVPQPNTWMGPKIAIIGTAPSSRMLAPYNDPSWKIWVCSPGNKEAVPRADAWFEVHANLLWPEFEAYGRPYLQWLAALPMPVFMQAGVFNQYVPNALPFPKDEMVAEFGPYFFTSSFAWMMAFAITMGAKEVAMFGIDMASRDEYILQRPGGHYFIVEGARRGIKIWAPFESDIMQPPGLYGYSDVTQLGRKLLARELELKQRLSTIDAQIGNLQRDSTYLRGALEDVDYFKSIHIGAQDNNSAPVFLERLRNQHSLAVATAAQHSPQPEASPPPPLPQSAQAVAPSSRKPGRPRKRPMPSVQSSPAGQG